MIRSLESLEGQQSQDEVKKFSVGIVKDFVSDLRRGFVDIDWDAEEASPVEQEQDGEVDAVAEDTELRQLFADDDDETGLQRGRRKWKRKLKEGQKLLPNSKNVENERNLALLQEKVDKIKNEINDWAATLDKQNPTAEWTSSLPTEETVTTTEEDINTTTVTELQDELAARVDKLYFYSHLLKSHSDAFQQISTHKLNKLSSNFNKITETDNQDMDPKLLLRGLSESLLKR